MGRNAYYNLMLMIALQYFMKLSIEVLFGTPMAYAVIVFLKKKLLKERTNG